MMDTQIGLVYNKDVFADGDTSWIFDSTSIEEFGSSWLGFGYEIIFRPEEIRAPERVIDELKEGFIRSFGLSSNHYEFDPTFWRIYWDRGGLRASHILNCEDTHPVRDFKHFFQPMGYINEYIKVNTD